jgi:hypothetical protein
MAPKISTWDELQEALKALPPRVENPAQNAEGPNGSVRANRDPFGRSVMCSPESTDPGGGSLGVSAIGSTSLCEHPVRLSSAGQVNRSTGEWFGTDPLAITVRCKNRRASKCRSCSNIYEGDAYQVVSSGWKKGSPFVWLTLTAPTFSKSGKSNPHHIGPGKDGVLKRCKCGSSHAADSPKIGAPFRPADYDYATAAAWNAHLSQLWTATVKAIRKRLPEEVRFDFVKAVEWQRRGAGHLHILGRCQLPAAKLERVVMEAVTAARVIGSDGEIYTWGAIPGPGAELAIYGPGSNAAQKRFGYLSKYSTKSAAETLTAVAGPHAEHLAKLARAAQSHARGADGCKCRWSREEGIITCRRCKCGREGLGHGGHVFSKSQKWGRTFAQCREDRSAWGAAKRNADAEAELKRLWDYAGRGHTDDVAAQLAEAVNDAMRPRPPTGSLAELLKALPRR